MNLRKRPGVDVQLPDNYKSFAAAEVVNITDAFNVVRVKRYIQDLLRKGMSKFVGKPYTKESREALIGVVTEVYNHVLDCGVLEEGWSIYAEEDFDDPSLVKVRLLPPCKKQLPERHNSSVGMAVANMQGVTQLAKETKGAEMNKAELIACIAKETGISVSRLLIEKCNRRFTLSVDVLNGTENERWAAVEALHKYRPAATEAHVSAPRDVANCSLCGTRLKVVELSRKGKVQAKSRCSNHLCKNSRHWMPSYRPASTRPSPQPMAFAVDHGHDEPGSWGPAKPKPPEWWRFNPPDKITSPMFKNPPPPEALDIRKAICESEPLAWRPVLGEHVVSWSGGLWGHIEDVMPVKEGDAREAIFLIRLYKVNSPGIAVGATMELTLNELLRGWKPAGDEVEKPRWVPAVGACIEDTCRYRFYITGTSGYGKEFELTSAEGRLSKVGLRELFEKYVPVKHWYPQVNMWVRSGKRTGCVNRMIDPRGNWLVQFTDQLGPEDVPDTHMLQNFYEVPGPKSAPQLKEPVSTGNALEFTPGTRVRHKTFGHAGTLLRRTLSEYSGNGWTVHWHDDVESDVSDKALREQYDIVIPLESRMVTVQNKDLFKREHMGEFLPAWPEHINASWVGNRIVHKESGEVCTLGHLSSHGWHVHVPLQGTWCFSEQDIFRLFDPLPTKAE